MKASVSIACNQPCNYCAVVGIPRLAICYRAIFRAIIARLKGIGPQIGPFWPDTPSKAPAVTFDGHIPQGTVVFHEAFKADGQEGAGRALRPA
jgi:hypothetical protein